MSALKAVFSSLLEGKSAKKGKKGKDKKKDKKKSDKKENKRKEKEEKRRSGRPPRFSWTEFSKSRSKPPTKVAT
jgi:hypothetical protein